MVALPLDSVQCSSVQVTQSSSYYRAPVTMCIGARDPILKSLLEGSLW